jgi:hypothetical protein
VRRKLAILNVLLIAAIAAVGVRWKIHADFVELRWQTLAEQRAMVPAPPAEGEPSPPPGGVRATDYVVVADQFLLSKDRNPDVVIEAEPEKPLPELPAAYGLMNLGDGPSVIMSEKPGARHSAVRAGEMIGAFKLASIEGDTLTLEWEDRVIRKQLQELIVRKKEDAPAQPQRASAAQTSSRPPPPQPKGDAAPGEKITGGRASCQPGDDSPAGTVKNGMRKVLSKTPFGEACWWEEVR